MPGASLLDQLATVPLVRIAVDAYLGGLPQGPILEAAKGLYDDLQSRLAAGRGGAAGQAGASRPTPKRSIPSGSRPERGGCRGGSDAAGPPIISA